MSVGDAHLHSRTLAPRPEADERTHRCPCGGPYTHVGKANGVALIDGCDWCVRRWVRDPDVELPGRFRAQ